jgi:polar amino acid transport system substrate-binding protein/cystine transport system substrate-binding protein/membrane-bound lytic murein transglycosylase F
LRQGRFDFGVTEMLLAGSIASREGWAVEWAPPELPRFPLVLGLWKGDITLKRAIVGGAPAQW